MPVLLDELTAGPLATEIAPLIASGNYGAVSDLLKSTIYTKYGWITVAKFNAWCAANGDEYVNIETHAANSASPYYSAAKSLLRCLNGAVADGALNLDDQLVMGLLNSWPFVDGTGVTKNSLIALGTFPASRGYIIEVDCSIQAIADALRI